MIRVNDCPVCGKEINKKPIEYKKLKGLATCSKKCRAEYLKTYYIGRNNPNCKYGNETNIETYFRLKAQSIAASAAKRNLIFNIDGSYLYSLFEKQNGLCYYTKIPLKLVSANERINADPDVLSVDRIDSTKGYIIGNIVLAANCINQLKSNMTLQELQDIFTYIILNNSGNKNIKVKKLSETAILPKKSKLGDAGYDLFADKIEITKTQVKVHSGVAMQPDIGVYLEMYPRSSIYKKGLTLANSVGIIDNSYTGEIIAIFNRTKAWIEIKQGERFAQVIPKEYLCIDMEEVKELAVTSRGSDGFGSTGK